MVKAVIIDLDGTLIESHDAHVSSYKSLFKEKGLRVDREELKKHFGKTAEDIISELFPQLTKSQVKSIVLKKRRRFLENLDKVVEVKCATKFLTKASKKYKLALATSASNEEMNALIDHFNWRTHFELLMTSYDVKNPKPAPDLLLKIAERLKIEVGDCVFIGDSIYDALSARNAGMTFIGVRTGSFNKIDFDKQGFKSYKDLCELLIKRILF